jgi:oxygen-independent coproporphyrinogen-3 oxidase
MEELGIYIHIPFCKKKCSYCDFKSFSEIDESVQEKYINCVIKEIQNFKADKNHSVNTIYIGGGTPSFINANNIQKILQAIYKKWNIEEDVEITIEVNPGTVDKQKLETYKTMGINRLSIGLQSTNDYLLKKIGRIHTYNDFLDTYIMARKCGFENINIDLMLALPDQSLQDIMESARKVINLNPEHISIYSLILEEDTELWKNVNNGKMKLLEDSIERDMYWQTKKAFEEAGYKHYEISNYAKKGYESKHNFNCWTQKEYLGFGIAAHSYYDEKRFSKIDNLEKYMENIGKNNFEQNIIIEEENRTQEDIAKEYMMLGLRKIDGVVISQFQRKFELNPLFYFRFEISKLQEMDLIEVDLDNIRLTNKGLDLANIVFEEFV